MKSLFKVSSLLLMAATMTACSQKDLYAGGDDNTEANDFNFSTVETPNVTVSYTDQGYGSATSSVFFQLYTEDPLDEDGNLLSSVKPVFSGFTDENGTWSGSVEIPSYTTTLYAYTPSLLGTKLMSAKNGGKGGYEFSDNRGNQTQSSTPVATGLYTTAVTNCGWKEWLGTYSNTGMDSRYSDYRSLSGGVSYANVFSSSADKSILNVSASDAADLLSVHQSVIQINNPCPEKYRTSKDLKVSENAAVAVTMLGGNTGWSNTMGYYYYNENDVPTSRDQIHPILIFPNTQDGMYSAKNKKYSAVANAAKGVERGTTVQLYYYGPADNMSESQKTSIFPKGTRIGFILKSHAWNDGNAWTCSSDHFATSTPGLNTKGMYETGSGVAMYTPDEEHVLFSFEDHTDDENFSDVVFTLSTNPVGAFNEVTTLDDIETSQSIQKGVYAYEDLWPAQGDYDMNDVVVEASAEKVIAKQNKQFQKNGETYKTVSSANYLKSETFILTPYQNYAVNQNGLAFTIDGPSSDLIESAELTIDGVKADLKSSNGVYYLTDDVKSCLTKDIRLTVNYKSQAFNSSTGEYTGSYVDANTQSSIKPFIYRTQSNGKNWEVHITNEAPTANADMSYFGTSADKSDVANGIYYTRSGNYPFAFYLSGATISDMSSILESANESKSIDVLYPEFLTWSKSNGCSCKGWYKLSE